MKMKTEIISKKNSRIPFKFEIFGKNPKKIKTKTIWNLEWKKIWSRHEIFFGIFTLFEKFH